MLCAVILVVAVFTCLAASGPIITPEGIAESRGIGALFGRERDFRIPSPTQDSENHQPSQNPHTGRSLHGSPSVHKIQGRQRHGGPDVYGSHGFPGSYSSHSSHYFFEHGHHGEYQSPGFHDVILSRSGRHIDFNPSRGKSILSGIISNLESSLNRNKKVHEPLVNHRIQKRLPPGEQDNRESTELLRGIFSGIKKDIFQNEEFRPIKFPGRNEQVPSRSEPVRNVPKGHNKQAPSRGEPIRNVPGEHNKHAPSRSESLLSGIMSGIKRDIFEHASPRAELHRETPIAPTTEIPSRSDALLSGILGGIRRDIFGRNTGTQSSPRRENSGKSLNLEESSGRGRGEERRPGEDIIEIRRF